VARWFKPLAAVLLVLYALVQILSIGAREVRAPGLFDRSVLWLAAPAQNLLWKGVEGTIQFWQRYVFLMGTARENERLRLQRDELSKRLVGLKELEAENGRLRSLLGLAAREKLKIVTAPRIASGASVYEHVIRIRKGTRDGIGPGMPVLGARGVVGQVVQAGGSAADVLLLGDLTSAVDGVDQRSRARGILRGGGLHELHFDFLAPKDDVQVGDEVVTSGLDGVYPKGLPVGTVIKVESEGKGLYFSARVRPHVEFHSLEEVAVVLGEGP
jgi:rod shape-determining protein MreC